MNKKYNSDLLHFPKIKQILRTQKLKKMINAACIMGTFEETRMT